jgi:PAS domain S-box-containing protein
VLDSKEVEEEAILAALMGISEMMGNLTDVDELLDAIVRIAPRLVTVNRCAIFLRNPRAPEFRVTHAFSPDPAATALLMRLSLREADIEKLAHKLIRQRVPVMLRESKEPLLPAPIVEAFQIRSMLLVPLSYQDQVMGFIAIDEPSRDHLFTSREVNVVQAIADHAAVAIVHTRLVDAYRLEHRRSEALAGALCDGVITLDPQLRIVAMNPGAEALLGYRAEDVIGRPCADVFDDPMSPGVTSAIAAKLLAGSTRGSAVVPFRANDGSRVACLVTAVAVADAEGARSELLYALTRVDPDSDLTTRHPARTRGD